MDAEETVTRVDGNAAGGILGELLGFDFTVAQLQCRHCGEVGVGATTVVEIDADGIIVRCRHCTRTLLTHVLRGHVHTLLTPGMLSISWQSEDPVKTSEQRPQNGEDGHERS